MVGLMYLRPTGGGFYYGTAFGCVMRARVEVLLRQGLTNAEIALCFGRSRVTCLEGSRNVVFRAVSHANRSK